MSQFKSNAAYVMVTLSLGLMLTACGDDETNLAASGMHITEGNRQVISDTKATGFSACGSGHYGYAQPNGQYQSNNGQIRIAYQSSVQTSTTNNPIGYQYPTNQQNHYPYQYQQNNQYPSASYGSQVSIVIARNAQNIQGNQNTPQNSSQPYGYYVAQVQISGLQNPISASQCSLSSMSETTAMISGAITCQGAYQNAPQVTVQFGCQPR